MSGVGGKGVCQIESIAPAKRQEAVRCRACPMDRKWTLLDWTGAGVTATLHFETRVGARMGNVRSLVGVVLITALAMPVAAHQLESDRLAQQWRDAKRRELLIQQAAIAAQLAAIDGATPDGGSAVAVAPAARAAVAPVVLPPAPAPAAAPVPAMPKPGQDPAAAASADAAAKQAAADASNSKFAGLDFGVGLSFTRDDGTRDRIASASLVNGIVRVDDENNDRARVMLESHYFFTPKANFGLFGDNSGDIRHVGVGPFVALQPGTDEIIEAIGMGLMVGFRRGDSGQSFNLGFGYVIDPNTRVLGDGLKADQPLPAGETEIRYKDASQGGFLILSSFSF